MSHLKDNLVWYIFGAIVFPITSLGFFALMDARHEAKGTSVKTELRLTRQKLRELQNYERLAPSELYSPARQVTISELKQDEKELQESLKALE